jgi:hypothetical protein
VEGYGPMIPWQPVADFGLKQGANSIPMQIGKDKSDTQPSKYSTYSKAHLILSDELFCFIKNKISSGPDLHLPDNKI